MKLDDIDRAIIAETQDGLPLVRRPYLAVAVAVEVPESVVHERLTAMIDAGIIRRIGAVPNHYKLGFTANGMTVWDVPDDRIDELGEKVGALSFVSHCYQRPRHGADWPYNLFAMVHGRDRQTVEGHVAAIQAVLGDAVRAHDILYSTRILKKTGFRLAA